MHVNVLLIYLFPVYALHTHRGSGNDHQVLADNHSLGFRTIVIRRDNLSSLTSIDSDKKTKQTLSCERVLGGKWAEQGSD